jgi:hypothetical protein
LNFDLVWPTSDIDKSTLHLVVPRNTKLGNHHEDKRSSSFPKTTITRHHLETENILSTWRLTARAPRYLPCTNLTLLAAMVSHHLALTPTHQIRDTLRPSQPTAIHHQRLLMWDPIFLLQEASTIPVIEDQIRTLVDSHLRMEASIILSTRLNIPSMATDILKGSQWLHILLRRTVILMAARPLNIIHTFQSILSHRDRHYRRPRRASERRLLASTVASARSDAVATRALPVANARIVLE